MSAPLQCVCFVIHIVIRTYSYGSQEDALRNIHVADVERKFSDIYLQIIYSIYPFRVLNSYLRKLALP